MNTVPLEPKPLAVAWIVKYQVTLEGAAVLWASDAAEAEQRVRNGEFYRDPASERVVNTDLEGGAILAPETDTEPKA